MAAPAPRLAPVTRAMRSDRLGMAPIIALGPACAVLRPVLVPGALSALSSSAHARSARHRAGDPPPGDRAALRPARRSAGAPAPGQGLAPRPGAPRAPVRARAPSEGDQRRGRSAHLAGRGLAWRARVAQRGQRLPPGPPQSPRPGGAARPPGPAAATRKARAEEGRRAYEAEQRAREQAADQAKHDPFGSRVPDHSVVHRYARCLSYPEWGVGSVTGIYFTGDGDDVQQWARVKFSPGVRTVPAGSLQFVDFSKPDPGAERVQRFMTAAQHALAEGDYPLAAKRLIYARDAEPGNPSVLRLMTLAFWQAGELSAAGRAVRDWARVEGERPAPHRFAARIYEDMGAIDLAAEAADRAAARGPEDADAWERVGRLRLRLMDREAAITALEHARRLGPSVDGLLDLALAYRLAGDT